MNEVGRELKASELKVGTVVVVKPPGYENYMTLWVEEITPKLVTLYAGMLHWHFISFVQPDDTIADDQYRTVHVFEYLGEI